MGSQELKSNLEKDKNKAGIKLETNNSSSVLKITTEQGVSITHGLAALLGTGTRLDLRAPPRGFREQGKWSIYF